MLVVVDASVLHYLAQTQPDDFRSNRCSDTMPRVLLYHLTRKDYSGTLKHNEPLTRTRRYLDPWGSRPNTGTKGDT